MNEPSASPRPGDQLAGRVALIVGGGTTGDYPGTGSATARLFAAQGARVVVMGRTTESTSRTVDDITNEGGTAIAVVGDITSGDDCERAAQAATSSYGRLDIVVNNVAVHKHVSLDAFDESMWDDIYDGNLKAVARMTAHALPHLRAERPGNQRGGSIINIGSVAGVQATGALGYGTAKAAVEPLTRDMAAVLGKDHIRVNCIIPGHLRTPHVERVGGGSDDAARALRNGLNVLGTEGNGWDVAEAALFFASDVSRFITGQSLIIDGGVTSVLAVSQVMRTRAAGLA
jgi:NAD(P)-dependent dehydrogenase (short-subunit alcohol dehydrogenase family)